MKIFSYRQRSEIIKATVAKGTPMTEIINRMATGVADEISAGWPMDVKIVIFAGWGFKGACSLAAARFLSQAGYEVETYLFNIGGRRLDSDALGARYKLEDECPDVVIHDIVQQFDIPEISPDTLVLDGLFGAELDRRLPASFAMLIRAINESGADIVSIDVPTGLFSEWNDSNSSPRDIIHATLTLGVEVPCLAYVIKENLEMVGRWKLVNVGLDQDAMCASAYTYYLVTRHDVHCLLRERRADASKADFGSAVICAGSYGMMGAAVLATRGCLRAGAGKVTCYAPQCGYQVVQTAAPSAMFVADAGSNIITDLSLQSDYTGVGVGPGIGTDGRTVSTLESFLKMMQSKEHPVVLDADALNCIAKRPNMMNFLPQESVLTPHEGEFDRIFGAHSSTEARIKKALEVAAYHNVVIVLKGCYTAVVRPDGKVLFNSSGSPALATGGSGDVLTGVLTAFMAQNYEPEIAAIIAAFVHGMAGELAEEDHGTYGVTADDVADKIGRAIDKCLKDS